MTDQNNKPQPSDEANNPSTDNKQAVTLDRATLERLLSQGQSPSATIADDEIDLLELWQGLLRRKWLIVVVTFMVTLISAVAAINMTPQYESSVLIAPTGDGGTQSMLSQYSGLASMAGISLPSGGKGVSKVAEAKTILTSYQFLSEFIRDQQLKPILFEENWDAVQQRWKPMGEPGLVAQAKSGVKSLLTFGKEGQTEDKTAKKDTQEPSMQEAVKKLKKQISLSEEKDTGMLTITVTWQDPQQAQLWASTLVARVDRLLREKAITESQEVVDYLQKQIETIRLADIRDMALKMIEEEMKQLTFARVKPEYVFKVLDPAIVPEGPTKPKKPLIVAVGFVLGGMLSVFLALILNVRRNRQTNHADAQA